MARIIVEVDVPALPPWDDYYQVYRPVQQQSHGYAGGYGPVRSSRGGCVHSMGRACCICSNRKSRFNEYPTCRNCWLAGLRAAGLVVPEDADAPKTPSDDVLPTPVAEAATAGG